jgi:(2Fe-2S) ferredoxin
MTTFQRQVTVLGLTSREDVPNGHLEYEDFPHHIDVTAPLLHSLFQESWAEVGLGHMVDGSVLELEFTAAPKLCRLYDGYLTVLTEGWHMHLCLEKSLGGPDRRNSEELSNKRIVSRAALYRRINQHGQAKSWGIQFWNGAGERMMNVFLPNIFVGEAEDLLPEHKPNLAKLKLYERLRRIYILGEEKIPYESNPLKTDYIAVCKSTRCNADRSWEQTYAAVQAQVAESGLPIEVINSGCLEVCKAGPVLFYSTDKTWYTRVTPEVVSQIMSEHVIGGQPVVDHVYPPQKVLAAT